MKTSGTNKSKMIETPVRGRVRQGGRRFVAERNSLGTAPVRRACSYLGPEQRAVKSNPTKKTYGGRAVIHCRLFFRRRNTSIVALQYTQIQTTTSISADHVILVISFPVQREVFRGLISRSIGSRDRVRVEQDSICVSASVLSGVWCEIGLQHITRQRGFLQYRSA